MKKKLKLLNFLVWYKNLYESIARQEFFLSQQALKRLQEKREEVKREIEESYQKVKMIKVLKGEEIRNFFLELWNLVEIKGKLELEISAQKKEKERLLEILRGRYKERKLIEILRDKVEESWEKEEEKRFYNEMNELVLLLRVNRERENI